MPRCETRKREDALTLVCERDQRILILLSNRNRDFSSHLIVVQLKGTVWLEIFLFDTFESLRT